MYMILFERCGFSNRLSVSSKRGRLIPLPRFVEKDADGKF